MFESFTANLNRKMLVRLLRENFGLQKFSYGVAICAMIVIAITTALTAWIMADIIDTMVESGDRFKVFTVAAAVALIFTVKGVATYVQVVFLSRAGNSIVAAQQQKLYDNILQHGIAFFSERGVSDILNRVTLSAQSARSVIDTIVMGAVRDLLTLIGLIVVMFYQQPTLSLFSIIFGPIAIIGIRKILSRVGSIVEAQIASSKEIIKIIQETSAGIRVIKAFALEERMSQRMGQAVSTVENRSNAMARLSAATSPLMEILSGFAIASVVALSAVNIFGESTTTAGELMSFVTALLMAYEPAKRLARMRISIESGMIGVGMMYQVLDTPITIKEVSDAVPLPGGAGAVRFKDVSFQYGADQDKPILKHLDIEFKAGQTTALVGPSGGGKSTIINLILRLYDPTSGSIEIDGCDLRAARFDSLRDKIAFVGQETFLFEGTVRHNITLGKETATEAEIIAAAKAANAHEFITKMPQGYDADIGENGFALSGGQRQRIAIARAILRDSAILLMDEATSALDSESEHLVKEALLRLSEGRTTIVIAHRLSTVLSADQILVLKEGEVIEQGKLAELLELDGVFRTLYDLQYNQPDAAS
ncbi:Putative multidrug export ATP-binding/permease protein (plasmid) [Roseobacter fucihabitans]|uniref:Multidrug export ATP-binding/permease protein n=1 Tax=Roseobacter fucihabitans TaxID=1537242 RepID=A0ABZ2BZE6_9RHOB|nr:ABC transporter ATP-binding protein [Roseobacter litoralis]MBC6967596.1 putative multidrug export ATP-binding/permease protein [Roseobacter litoralis]